MAGSGRSSIRRLLAGSHARDPHDEMVTMSKLGTASGAGANPTNGQTDSTVNRLPKLDRLLSHGMGEIGFTDVRQKALRTDISPPDLTKHLLVGRAASIRRR